jgi:presenilin-like A22 family membrane protease
MKHPIKMTTVILLLFLFAQFIGLFVIYHNIDIAKSEETGVTKFKQLPIGERPPVDEGFSFLPVIIAILIGTGFLFLLIKFKLMFIWKLWFLLAVVFALGIVLGTFFNTIIALALALAIGIWKIFRPNVFIHNITELFIYGGLAVVFVPLFNILSVVFLLILISAYDAYAVWKSKHMIKLAKSQTEAKVFAGLFIPYRVGKPVRKKITKKVSKSNKKMVKVKTAILGGGDIGFPLIFAGVIMKELGVWQSLIIPLGAFLGLAFLLYKGKENKFYPAMPFISGGCFLALGLVMLVQLVV